MLWNKIKKKNYVINPILKSKLITLLNNLKVLAVVFQAKDALKNTSTARQPVLLHFVIANVFELQSYLFYWFIYSF